MGYDISDRLMGLSIEEAYELGRLDGRAEMQDAINASEEYKDEFRFFKE